MTTETIETSPLPDGLAAIAAEASAEEVQAEADANPQPEPIMQPGDAWAQIPKALGTLLAMAIPELADVYTDEACATWGEGMAMVSEKYGWDAADTIAKWAPECALLMATIPLAVPTYFAVKVRIDAARQVERKRAAEPQQRPMKDITPDPDAPGGFSDPH